MRMTIKEFFSFKTNKFFWLNIIAMIVVVVVMVFGVLKWLDIHTHHGETVMVPDVKGMTVEEATKMFRNHGLVCVISDTKYVKDKAAGIVLDLKPGVGDKVKEGRTVYLTVNTQDIPLRVIPDVADNSSLRQAEAKLQSAGFKLTEIQLIHGEKDWVYGVKYQGRQLAAGEKVPVGASLTLMVGNGAGDMTEEDIIGDDTDTEKPVPSDASSTQDDSWF
ncbi:PASTA domain-containing protein [Bacteroides sp. f07]|jgi:beta-lactam-binding protein with PASTA domain